jgi:hypothetical protein
MVCLGNICINTLHKGAKDDDYDDDDNNNNIFYSYWRDKRPYVSTYETTHGF